MFDWLKKLFRKESQPIDEDPDSDFEDSRVSSWASRNGLAYSGPTPTRRFSVEGHMEGMPWRMDLGRPSRRFILGEELRARAELGLPEGLAVLIMNRQLKRTLDKQIYQKYTNSLQTRIDSALPEEMRWLAMYDEVAWPGVSEAFWARYAVLANLQDHAEAWLDEGLVNALMQWPQQRSSDKAPFLLMLLKGQAQLCMECKPESMAVIRHARTVFGKACESARDSWPAMAN